MSRSRIIRHFSAILLFCIATPTIALAQATFQSTNAIDFNTGAVVSGAGTLTRDDDSVELRVALSKLDKKATYSVWWIIFNNPAECMAGGQGVCGESDLGSGAVDPAVLNAGGFMTGTDGTANFVSELDSGPAPVGLAFFGQLNDSHQAEIHIIVETHGDSLVGAIDTQMTIAGQGCNPDCIDQFALVFPPAGS